MIPTSPQMSIQGNSYVIDLDKIKKPIKREKAKTQLNQASRHL